MKWTGTVQPHHSYAVVPLTPVYDEQDAELDEYETGAVCTGNEGNIGIE